MGWWKRLFSEEANAPRTRQASPVDSIEVLEPRVVLGSITPFPSRQAGAPSAHHVPADGQSDSAVLEVPGLEHTVHDASAADRIKRSTVVPVLGHQAEGRTPRPETQRHTSIVDESSPEHLPDSLEERGDGGPADRVTVPPVAPAADRDTRLSSTNERGSTLEQRAVTSGLERVLVNPTPETFIARDAQQTGSAATEIPWFDQQADPVKIRYDFRDLNGVANEISDEQQAVVDEVFSAWTDATNGRIQWVRDTHSADEEIVLIGLGDLAAVNLHSAAGGTIGVGSGQLSEGDDGATLVGTVWLDRAEAWDNRVENGNPAGTVDFFTVMVHETGHVLGLEDRISTDEGAIMNPAYTVERSRDAIAEALHGAVFFPHHDGPGANGYALNAMVMGFPQLAQSEVDALLQRASAATSSEDAIIAVVDRNGTILGVRAEQDVLDNFTDPAELAFAIDGAVSKARTAAFFANDTAPLTSRLIRFISQSTVTERELDSNPNITDPDSTERGPGFVAPIGLGGHFPPDINFTPPVDLFGIEHTNRDSLRTPGPDRIIGTGDDVLLPYRFNIDPTDVPAGQEISAPLSYGDDAGIPGSFQNRGIATLPGGVPIFRDTDADGIGDTLIGGIGVFFPGPDGYATFEQGFAAGSKQTTKERTNSPKVLEAEFIAVAAVGGSREAARQIPAAGPATIGGITPVDGLDLPFGNLSLVGINLQVIGPQAGILGVERLAAFARRNLDPGTTSGANQVLGGGVFLRDGASVADGHLITPQSSATDDLTAEDVNQIVDAAIAAAEEVRAAVRLDPDRSPGARTRMVFAITDTTGELLGLYRMEDATVFSIDVAVAKARNVAYYADAAALHPDDQIDGVDPGTALSNRTFRFVAEPRFPDGIDGTEPPPFSILQDAAAAGIDPGTGENTGAPAPASVFESVLGFDAFNPGTNFRDPDNLENQNGIVFFPGSTPLYKDGVLVGGFGVSGDGVDQDDVVTFLAAQGFLPDGVTVQRADQTLVRGVRLPYMKFLRNPFG